MDNAFASAGKKLADLHLNYESGKEYSLKKVVTPGVPLGYVVADKMKLNKDKTELRVNDSLTLTGIPLTVFFIVFVMMHLGATRVELVASMGNPLVAILMALTVISMLWHMRLGLQVVIEDYVHAALPKYLSLLFNTFFTAILGVAALYAILKMSFGL